MEFCDRLETVEKTFQIQGEVNHQNQNNKQSGERHQSANSAQIKDSYQAVKLLEEEANKNKTQKKNHLCSPCMAMVTI